MGHLLFRAGIYMYTVTHPVCKILMSEMCVYPLLYIYTADLSACTFGENQTPIHYAAKNDADSALKELINIGADVNCRDYKQRTPLHVAAELGMLFIYKGFLFMKQFRFSHVCL